MFKASLSWWELARRTWRAVIDDDVPGLAAQLSFYLVLALFPALLCLLALASFFPLSDVTDDVGRSLGPFVSSQVLSLVQDQMRRLANSADGGLLTVGALWTSSAALVSVVGALNRAAGVREGRPWWRVRLVAMALTLGVVLLTLMAMSIVLAGPVLAQWLGRVTGWGAPFEWAWFALQWPLVIFFAATGMGLVYRFGPDSHQRWTWTAPGAVAASMLWLLVSLAFKLYVVRFPAFEASYGAVGGVIVLLLWFYLSGIAVLAGAELNAEIGRASRNADGPAAF